MYCKSFHFYYFFGKFKITTCLKYQQKYIAHFFCFIPVADITIVNYFNIFKIF